MQLAVLVNGSTGKVRNVKVKRYLPSLPRASSGLAIIGLFHFWPYVTEGDKTRIV